MIDFRLVFLSNPSHYRSCMLTDHQMKLFNFVAGFKFEGVTAAYVAECQKVTVQCASVKLRALHEKSYLRRIEEVCPTGGTYYRYVAFHCYE